jgi:hypothetical protein
MAARFAYDFSDNLPKIPVKLYEGTATRGDVIGADGLVMTDAITYSAPIVKGDYVKLKDDSNSGGEIVVEKFVPGNEENNIIGRIVDAPKGTDAVTTSGQAPAHAQRRRATLALRAVAVVEMTADGVQVAGQNCVYKESGASVTVTAGGAVPAANGVQVALAHALDATKFPVALGYFEYQPAD